MFKRECRGLVERRQHPGLSVNTRNGFSWESTFNELLLLHFFQLWWLINAFILGEESGSVFSTSLLVDFVFQACFMFVMCWDGFAVAKLDFELEYEARGLICSLGRGLVWRPEGFSPTAPELNIVKPTWPWAVCAEVCLHLSY